MTKELKTVSELKIDDSFFTIQKNTLDFPLPFKGFAGMVCDHYTYTAHTVEGIRKHPSNKDVRMITDDKNRTIDIPLYNVSVTKPEDRFYVDENEVRAMCAELTASELEKCKSVTEFYLQQKRTLENLISEEAYS